MQGPSAETAIAERAFQIYDIIRLSEWVKFRFLLSLPVSFPFEKRRLLP